MSALLCRRTMTGGHRRILVVEDDPETAGQLVEQLTTSGYQVDLAQSGNEALSRGRACDYAVITIDRMLPDIDGIAVMRQLRDDGIAAPVLIISALGEVDDRVRGLRAGGDDYLVKPFSFVARSTASRPIRSSIRFSVSGTVSVLLAKTLRSSTFKLALIAIATFGVIVSALFSYVYLSTSSYVRGRSDRAIMTEVSSLRAAYERSGRDGLIALIGQRIADKSFADN